MQKIKSLLLLFAIILCAQLSYSNSLITDSVRIDIQLPAEGIMRLRYLDAAFKEQTLQFSNASKKDTIVSKKVELLKPTEFRYVVITNTKTIHHNFLFKGGETVKIKLLEDYDLAAQNKVNFLDSIIYRSDSFERDPIDIMAQKGYSPMYLEAIDLIYKKNTAQLSNLFRAGKISSTDKSLYNILNETDHYIRVLSPVMINREVAPDRKEFVANTVQQLEEQLPELQVLDHHQLKFLYIGLVRTKLALLGKDPQQVDDFTSMLLSTKLPKAIQLTLLLEKLKELRDKTSSEFVRNFDKAEQLAGGEYSSVIANFKAKAFPIIPVKENITLENSSGQKLTFYGMLSAYKGKVIVIDLWASWCVPCRKEFPQFEEQKAKFKNENVAFVSISLDADNKVQEWQKALKEEGKTKANDQFRLNDPKRSPLNKILQLATIPRYVVIDAKGRVINGEFYRPSDKEFEPALKQILAKK